MNDFRHELSDFADQTDIGRGSASAVARTARRRTQASAAARVGAVALVATAGVLGVRALSSPGLEGEPIDPPNGVASADGTTPTGSTTPADPTATAAPLPGSIPTDPANDDWLASAPQTRPAEYVDLNYTWTAYPADSPEAVALRFSTEERYVVGTADGGRNQRPSEALYEQTADGWELVETLDSDLYVNSSVAVGDVMYLVVSNPDEYRPDFEWRAFDFASRSWKDVTLPDGADAPLPDGSALSKLSYAEVAARDDVLIFMESTEYEIDAEKLGLGDIVLDTDRGPDSIRIADTACLDEAENRARTESGTVAPGAVVPIGSSVPVATPSSVAGDGATTVAASTSVPTPTSVPSTESTMPVPATTVVGQSAGVITSEPSPEYADPHESCFRAITMDELGLSEADQALAAHPTTKLWTFDGSAWTQRQLPGAEGDEYNLFDGGVLSHSHAFFDPEAEFYGMGSTTYYEMRSDGSFAALYDGHQFAESWWARSGPPSASGRAVTSTGPYIVNQDLQTAQWTATDLNTLGEQTGWSLYDAEPYPEWAGPDGSLIATGTVMTQLPKEPTELTSGQYTLRFPTSFDNGTILIDNSTGEEVHDVYLSTESGRITMMKPSDRSGGHEVLAEFDTDWTSVPYLNIKVESALFISSDGVHFGVIDGSRLSQAANLAVDDNERLHIEGAERREDQVILRVSVSAPDTADGYFVIVGTPN